MLEQRFCFKLTSYPQDFTIFFLVKMKDEQRHEREMNPKCNNMKDT